MDGWNTDLQITSVHVQDLIIKVVQINLKLTEIYNSNHKKLTLAKKLYHMYTYLLLTSLQTAKYGGNTNSFYRVSTFVVLYHFGNVASYFC